MARIAKPGLEYFPFDIDFFQDLRIRKLIKRQGGKAVTVYALLLCLIYKNGYYMQWDKDLPFIGSEMSGFEEAYISEVIKSCLSLGLFDKHLFETEEVLTSKGIQARYCTIQRLNKRMSRIDRYSLLDQPQRDADAAPRAKSGQGRPAKPVTPQPPAAAPLTPRPPSGGDNAGWLTEFFAESHGENLRLLCNNLGLGADGLSRLRTLAEAVIAEWELSHTRHRDYSDWSRHLISAIRIKNRDSSPKSDNHDQQTTPTASDYTFSGGFGGQDV